MAIGETIGYKVLTVELPKTTSRLLGGWCRTNEAMEMTKSVTATLLKSDAPVPKPVLNALHL